MIGENLAFLLPNLVLVHVPHRRAVGRRERHAVVALDGVVRRHLHTALGAQVVPVGVHPRACCGSGRLRGKRRARGDGRARRRRLPHLGVGMVVARAGHERAIRQRGAGTRCDADGARSTSLANVFVFGRQERHALTLLLLLLLLLLVRLPWRRPVCALPQHRLVRGAAALRREKTATRGRGSSKQQLQPRAISRPGDMSLEPS